MSKLNDIKASGIKALLAVREVMPASALAIEVYLRASLKGSVETYQRKFRSCFDSERSEYFWWWEVIAMMQITGCHEPLFYLCDLLGYERPKKVNPSERAGELRSKLAMIDLEREQIQREMAALPTDAEPEVARFSRAK